MNILAEINWQSGLIGAGVTGLLALILFLLKWIRFSPKDKVEVKKDDAAILKLNAEAAQIQVQSDATVADLAMKIAQDLRVDNQNTKVQLAETEQELDKTVELCRTLSVQLDDVKRKLENEIAKNLEMTTKISELVDQIKKLQIRGDEK